MANKVITVTDPSVVTNDTLAGYNNYSDIDGQLGTTMTPTEATNGKTITLSDGVVHEVTTKPVGTTNGEFSAVVSNSVQVDLSGGVALFEDDFTGTTIDTAKWNYTEPNPAWAQITQNNGLVLDVVGKASGSVCDTNLTGKTAYSIDSLLVCSFDIQNSTQDSVNAFYSVGITKDSEASSNINRICVQRQVTAGQILCLTIESSVNVSSQTPTLDISTVKTIKIVVDSTNVKFYYWDTSGTPTWTQLGATYAHASSGNWYPVCGTNANTSGTIDDTNVYNYVLTDTDFATQRP